MNKKINIAFMGTPEFAEKSLEALYNEGYNIPLVITKVDKPVGRKKEIKFNKVKEFAIKNNIEIMQPEKVKNNEELINKLKSLNLDFICVVAYGKILPKEILDIPKYGCINVHGSLLPKYRGSAPIQWSIINGEEYAGVTTMFMDVGMDTGDMLLKEKIKILEEDNLETVYNKLQDIGGKLLVETIDKVIKNEIIPEKQGDDFTLAPMISKEMTKIDFNKSSRKVFNFTRGLNPIPSVYMEHENGSIYKVGKVKEYTKLDINDYKIGEIVEIKNELIIKCRAGYISILEIKPEGKKMMNIKDFLNGSKLNKGEIFK